jgi:thioredoxin-dependent peroxiredoxin
MLGKPVPDLKLTATGSSFKLSDLKGHPAVLFFYPKDNTPGCTSEAKQFRDLYPKFKRAGVAVYGVSRDSIKSHQNFIAKQNLPFDLVSDPDEAMCAAFGVMKIKSMFGLKVRGIQRSTFVIDAKGVLRQEWRGVKVPGHAQEVLDFVKAL